MDTGEENGVREVTFEPIESPFEIPEEVPAELPEKETVDA